MNKNVAILVLAIFAAIFLESTIFFYRQANKLNYQKLVLAKSLSEVREENKTLKEKNDTTFQQLKDYKIDKIISFRALQK